MTSKSYKSYNYTQQSALKSITCSTNQLKARAQPLGGSGRSGPPQLLLGPLQLFGPIFSWGGPILVRSHIYKPPYSPAPHKSVKIASIHSNCTTLTLTLKPKLKITPFLTLNRRWAVRGFVITRCCCTRLES